MLIRILNALGLYTRTQYEGAKEDGDKLFDIVNGMQGRLFAIEERLEELEYDGQLSKENIIYEEIPSIVQLIENLSKEIDDAEDDYLDKLFEE